jgi:hypothetical protein
LASFEEKEREHEFIRESISNKTPQQIIKLIEAYFLDY